MIGGYRTEYVTDIIEMEDAINRTYPGIYCQGEFSYREEQPWSFTDFMLLHSGDDYYNNGSTEYLRIENYGTDEEVEQEIAKFVESQGQYPISMGNLLRDLQLKGEFPEDLRDITVSISW